MYRDVEPGTCVHLIRSITDLCPQLYKLRIDLWKRTPQDAFLDVIGPHTFANLKALAISIKHQRGWFHQYSLAEDERPRFFELTYKDVIKFLSRFSSLRHLYIPGGLICKRAGLPSLPPPPSFRLYELACSGVDFNRAPRESILDWCLAENQDTLKIFSIDNLKHTLSWVSFLRRHGKNIRSLQICRHDNLIHVENNLRELCPYLQELI
ncbi:hypothetical protein FRC02_011156 [Tulasnella sp. 418]|nr:hypothetical protein FRC02_011156 [Tulasnella sp. 418]